MLLCPCCLVLALTASLAAGAGDEGCSFSGVWETNWGVMKLVQNGENVSGTYEYYEGRITGVASGNVMEGSWSEAPSHQPDSDAGEINLTLSQDCQTLIAEWRHGTGSNGPVKTWAGTRLRAAPAEDRKEVEMADYDLGDLVYSDDFSSSKSGWERHSDGEYLAAYEAGRYAVTVLPANLWRQSRAGLEVSDFVMEVEAAPVAGPDDNAYGVTVRDDGAGDYYAFVISGDGYFAANEMENNSWVYPFAWERSDAILRGNATNVIQVAADGGLIAFYVNGKKLCEYKDESLTSGDVGLLVGTQDEGMVKVAFDNIRIWAFASKPAPQSEADAGAEVDDIEAAGDVADTGDESPDASEEISHASTNATSENPIPDEEIGAE